MSSAIRAIERARLLVAIARSGGVTFRWHKGRVEFRGATLKQTAFLENNERALAPAILMELVNDVFGAIVVHDASGDRTPNSTLTISRKRASGVSGRSEPAGKGRVKTSELGEPRISTLSGVPQDPRSRGS